MSSSVPCKGDSEHKDVPTPSPESLYPARWVDCPLLREKEGSAPTREHLKHPQSAVSRGRSLSTLRWENTRHLGKVRGAKIQTPVPSASFSHSAMGKQSASPPFSWKFLSQERNAYQLYCSMHPNFHRQNCVFTEAIVFHETDC